MIPPPAFLTARSGLYKTGGQQRRPSAALISASPVRSTLVAEIRQVVG